MKVTRLSRIWIQILAFSRAPGERSGSGSRDCIARLGFVFTLVWSNACSGLIALKEQSLVRTMARTGVVEKQIVLGGDKLQLWMGGDGDGRPILWIHGFGASAPWQWSKQVEHLALKRRVIVPNLLWFGASTCEHSNFSLDHQIEVLRRALAKLGTTEVDVVGISYGGLVAYGLTVLYPGLVKKLVMVDSPGPVFSGLDLERMHKRLDTDDLSEVFVPRDEKGVKKLLRIAYYRPPFSNRSIRGAVVRELVDPTRKEQVQLLSAMRVGDEPWRGKSGAPQVQALVVWGAEDTVFPLELGQRLATFLDAEIRIVDQARHVPNMEHSGQFNAIIEDFLF